MEEGIRGFRTKKIGLIINKYLEEFSLKIAFLRKKVLTSLIVLPLLFSSGCVYLAVGGIGAVGGYIVSPDTVEGITENDADTVADAAVEIISIMGTILEEHQDGGLIKAKINGANVTVTVLALNKNSVKLLVKARKFYLPRISIAQDIYVKIMSYLSE